MAKRKYKTKSREDIKQRVSAFIYGFPGAGKTFLARSLVEHKELCPALIVVCDAGDMTIKDLVDDTNFVVAPGTFDNLTAIFEEVSGKNPDKFKSIFIDNLTELHRTALLDRARITSTNKPRSEYEFTLNDYGVARNQILAVVSAFATQLPDINVFATALAVNQTDEFTGKTSIIPDLSGKLGAEVPGYFDLVAYLNVENPRPIDIKKAEKAGKEAPTSYRLLTVNQSSTIPVARNRGGKFTENLENPILWDIYDRMTA